MRKGKRRPPKKSSLGATVRDVSRKDAGQDRELHKNSVEKGNKRPRSQPRVVVDQVLVTPLTRGKGGETLGGVSV